MEFLETTYEAATELGGWDRAALERGEPAAVEAAPHGERPEAPPLH